MRLMIILAMVGALLLTACAPTSASNAPAAAPTAEPQPKQDETPRPAPTATPQPTATAALAATPTMTAPEALPADTPKETPTPQPTSSATPEPEHEPGTEHGAEHGAETDPASALGLPSPPEHAIPRYMHKAALLPDGRVMMSSGFSGVANNNVIVPLPLEDFQIFDPETDLWLQLVPEENRIGLSDTVRLSDGMYLTVGIGVTEDGEVSGAATLFDPDAQSWEALSAPSLTRLFPQATLLSDGRVIVIGGTDMYAADAYSVTHVKETEIFDPKTAVWQQSAAMNDAMQYQAVALLQDGRVMVVNSEIANAEIYDLDSDSWTLTSEMNSALAMPKSVTLLDGKVLVTGLRIDDSSGSTPAAEIYDPETDTWSASGTMNAARFSHTLTLLQDGRVLATGGVSDDFIQIHRTTEIFDPATNRWTAGTDMSERRYDHTATLMPDGAIFLFGGVTLNEDIDEIYPTNSFEFISIP